MTGFATDLQLVLDEGIMWTRLVGRRMMGTTLEWTPTKRTTRWSPTTRRRSTSWTTTTLATATVVWSSGHRARWLGAGPRVRGGRRRRVLGWFRSGFVFVTSIPVDLRIFGPRWRNACRMTRMHHRIIQRRPGRFHVRETRSISGPVRVRSEKWIVMMRAVQRWMNEWVRLRVMHH